MKLKYVFFLPLALFGALASVSGDAVENSVKAITPFKSFSMESVSNGQILKSRTSSAGLDQVEAVQTCFILAAPVSKVSALLLNWNPAGKPGLEVTTHQALSGAVTPASFQHSLASYFSNSKGGAWMLKQSQSAESPSSELSLTAQEKAQLAAAAGSNRIANAWSSILSSRFNSFHAHPTGDFVILVGAIKRAGPIAVSDVSPKASYYWEFSDVDNRGTISEGVSWQDRSNNLTRVSDGEFFVTSEYKASFNTSTLWPVSVKGKEATLVWRIDSGLSDQFTDLRGAERMVSAGMILTSVEKTILAVRQELSK